MPLKKGQKFVCYLNEMKQKVARLRLEKGLILSQFKSRFGIKSDA